MYSGGVVEPLQTKSNGQHPPGRGVSTVLSVAYTYYHLVMQEEKIIKQPRTPPTQRDDSFRRIALLQTDTGLGVRVRHLKNKRRTAEGQMHAPGSTDAKWRSRLFPACS